MIQKFTKKIIVGSMFLLSFIVLSKQYNSPDINNPSVLTEAPAMDLSGPDDDSSISTVLWNEQDHFSLPPENPIINYFNEVNNDTDPNNDLEGEIVQCSIDGDFLPLFFLCGSNDSALLTLNVSATSISWEKLIEGSCDSFGDQCPNKSPVCGWTTVGSGNSFALNTAGNYRVVLNTGSGNQERYYFNAYQNNLQINYAKADIGCEPTGNIQILDLDGNYAFRLVNADNNAVVVPFSANNGPLFDIASNGNYRVEVTQTANGVPIQNSCIFSTPEIAIGTSNFSVSATSTEADCTGVGTVTANLTGGSPDYAYELRLDDGLDGGRGTLIDVVTGISEPAYTFEGVGQGNYLVVGRNADGCEQSAATTVLIDNSNTLRFSARVSQHITCKEGNILVDPSGGKPRYRYAIWKYVDEDDNTLITYNSPDEIPEEGQEYGWQTSEIFDILTPGNYTFVVRDRFSCYVISNSVDIEFVPPATFDDITEVDVACFEEATGALQMNLIDDGGYQLTYYLFDHIISEIDVLQGNFDTSNAIAFNSSGYFPGLMEGDYTIVVNMRKGSASCDYPYYGSIGAPDNALEGEAVILQQYSCVEMGEIAAANVFGGNPDYTFSLSGGNGTWQTGINFDGLAPGVYTIFIRDQAGCVVETNPVEILPVNEPENLQFDPTQITCDNPTSDLTVTVVGGTEPLVVEIISPSAVPATSISGHTAEFNDLAPGTYRFRVTDAGQCTYEESFTILPISEINVAGELLRNISCEGLDDGALRFTVGGFENTYSYTVQDGAGATVASENGITTTAIPLSDLAGGSYTIRAVDDITQCESSNTIIVQAPASAIDATLTVTEMTCSTTGTNPASVTINATGGWGSYQYELRDPSGATQGPQPTNTFNNLTDTSGDYTVTITDAGGCAITRTFRLDPISTPVLTLSANSLCYDDITGLTITATVTGGAGNFRYRLNNGGYTSDNIFDNLAPGTYTVDVIDGKNCTDTETLTVSPQMGVSASARPIPSCENDTEVLITANGGDGNFIYALVPTGNTPSAGDFNTSNTRTISSAGTYDVYVRDNGGNTDFCEASNSVTINQDPALQMAVDMDPEVIPCSGENNGSITINASGGSAPYQYSIDGGSTYQTQNTFYNLGSGDYIVMVQDANGCTVSETRNIPEIFTLSASAAVTQSPNCNPDLGTEVRIMNAQGGTEPYEYSFDGGNTYGATNIAYLQPGTHVLFLRDANGCSYEMSVTVEPAPEQPTFSHAIAYDCTGEGTVTVTPSSTDYDYAYSIDSSPNTPSDSNVFTNVSPGYHTITVDYLNNTPLAPSMLLSETFGAGANTAISEVDPVYCYEPQNGTDNGCPHASAINNINDGEYSVTQQIVSPFGTWISPNDHTGTANGRYLAMNVGDVAGTLGIIYAKRDINVVANRDITISLWAINLLRNGTSGGDPNVLIELVDGSGNTIASTTTGNIPKNNGADDWRNYTVTLNPGANTNLDIVIRTFSIVTNGNDIAVDDIVATQTPEECTLQDTFEVYVEEGQALMASITAQANPLCVNDNSGSLSFEVENYDVSAGFVYSFDGGSTFSTPQTTTPVILNNLTAGTYNIIVRDATNASCETTITATLTDPVPIVATASVTQEMTCINMTAIITADATGGTPGYEYRLEDSAGVVISPYQTGTTFTVNAAGDYNIRVRDVNACEDLTDMPVSVNEPETVAFDVTATTCYSGNNDASIQIDVTAGNGNYQFQIDNGPWLTPSPTTATTYTFGSLPAGSYSVNVKDGLGCEGTVFPVTINPELEAIVDTTPISACADGSITVAATGGDNNYAYAFVPAGNDPTGNFTASNTYTVSAANAGSYDVYVRDNAGNNPYCEYLQTVVMDAPMVLAFTATPTDPQCNGENGQITVNITSGERPYDLELRDLDNGSALVTSFTGQLVSTRTFYNVPPGNYEVIVTDGYGCPVTQSPIAINDPVPLTAEIDPVLPANCDDSDALNYGFRFINYPTILNGTLQFSDDGGQTWSTSDTFMGHISGSSVFPSIRTVDSAGNTLCREDFPRYIIPYPLDDLNITVLPQIADCAELRVQVQGSEGDPPYEYTYTDDPANFDPNSATWDGPFAASYIHQYNNLIPGRTYVFFVRDDAGCVRQSDVNVNDLVINPFDIVGDFEPSCFGANDGSITFNITNNSGTTYPQMHWEFYDLNTGTIIEQSPGNVTWTDVLSFTDLSPSEYYVVVTGVDVSNTDQCVSGSENQLIIEQQPITADLLGQDMTCETPGYIHINNINGGGGSFTFNVTGPAGFTAIVGTTNNPIEIPAGSPTGSYAVQVVDQYGCEFVETVALTLPANPTIDNIAIDNCADPTTITVMATGPSPDFVYSIDGGITFEDNGGIFDNVAPGTYDIAVRDGNGCLATETITVYPVLQARAELTKLLDCSVSPEAEITIEALSGSGNYDIAINNGSTDVVTRTGLITNPYIFTTPDAGTYTITIWDNDTDPECFRELVVEVPALVQPEFDPTPIDVTCFGGSDGAIIINEVDRGVGPITYTISPNIGTFNAATGRFEGLTAGTYAITATAANACTLTVNAIMVGEPDEIVVPNPIVTEFGCTSGNNSNSASITIDAASIIGGSNTYLVYEFINDGTGAIVQRSSNTTYIETDLAGGNYTINVYDDNGCVGTTTAVIAPYDELQDANIDVAPVTCVPGNDGALTVNVTSSFGDASQFEYSRDNGGTYQDSNVFSGLSAGNYLVTVRHKETQCIITASATILEPNTFAIDVEVLQNVVCYNTDSGEVRFQFTDATYTGDFSYTVYNTNNTPADTSDDTTEFTSTSSVGVNTDTPVLQLGGGSYRVVAVQVAAPQCTQETVFSIATPEMAIIAEAVATPITCDPGNNGIIEIINANGGWGGYTYYVGVVAPSVPGDYVTSPRFENLSAATYQAWVRDGRGCEYQIPDTITLTDPDPITAALRVNAENCEAMGGEIEAINVDGGQGSNYTYQLILNGSDFGASQTDPVFSGLGEGSYEVRITDQWGCTETVGPEVLYAPMAVSYDIVQTINCDANGEITLTVTGGSGNFSYSVALPDGGTQTNTDGIFTGLNHTGNDPADYIFTVTDLDTDPLCNASVTVILDKPTPVTLEPTEWTDLSCPGSDDGTLTINLEPTEDGVNDDPVYTYTIVNTSTGGPAITQDTPLFTGLATGVYDITVTSGRNCVATDQVTINSPTPLDANITGLVQFACDADNTVQMAQIEVTVTSGTGTPDYFYSVNNGGFLPTNGEVFTFFTTVSGDYDIVIRDQNGCLFPLPTQTIEPLPQIALDITEGTADCPSGQEITVTSTGHSTNPAVDLTFELLETGEVQPNLNTDVAVFYLTEPGEYTVRVTDNVTGCYDTIKHTIDPYPVWNVDITSTTPIDCYDATTGSLEVTITDYTGAYDYQLFNADGTPAQARVSGETSHPLLIDNLGAGNYYVQIWPIDYPFCNDKVSEVETIEAPSAELLMRALEATHPAGCPDNLGEVVVDPIGGYAPYDITITHTDGTEYSVTDVNAHVFIGLPSGDYGVLVTDAQGCFINDTVTVESTDPIVASIASTNDPLCYADADGVIIVDAQGGAGTLLYYLNYYDASGSTIEYTVEVPQHSNEFHNLGEGYYSVTVTDTEGGCSDTTDVVFLDGPDPFSAEIELAQAMTCIDDALVTVSGIGGTAPYEFFDNTTNTWVTFNQTNGVNSHTFSVGEGTHHALIRDANQCEVMTQIPVVVRPIPPVQLTIDYATESVTCADDATGVIHASAIGGYGTYTYELILGGSVVATVNAIDAVFEDLVPGDYTVRVTSEGGCDPDEKLVSIANPEPLVFDYNLTPETCVGALDGSIILMLSGGGGGYQFAISPNLNQFFDEDPQQGLPEGQYRFDNLVPNTYTVIAQDANGCFYVEDITIEPATEMEVTPVSTPEICEGDSDGTISLDITGGTAPYRTALNSNTETDFVENRTEFTGLSAGTYLIFIRDAMDCEIFVEVPVDPGVNLNAEVVPVYGCNGNIPNNYVNVTLEDETIAGDVMYALDSTDPLDMQLNPYFRDLTPGSHYIAVASSSGCIKTYDFEIMDFEPLTLTLQQNNINEITAVAEGGREAYTFYFDDIDNGSDNTFVINRTDTYEVRVVDENGCEAVASIYMEFIDIEIPNFFTPNGDNENDFWKPRNIEHFPEILIKIYDRYGRVVAHVSKDHYGWDGKYNEKELPSGDYWYVIQLNGENDEREFFGHFTLYR